MSDEPIFTSLTPAEAAEAQRITESHATTFDPRKVVLKAPKTGAEAKARLDALQTDDKPDGWVARLMRGDVAATREFHSLSEMIVGDEAAFDPTAADAREHVPVFETVADGEISKSEQIRHAEGLREGFGLNDVMIKEMMTGINSQTGKPFTVADAAVAQSALARDLADPDFARRASTRGTREAARVLLLNGIIAAGSVKN